VGAPAKRAASKKKRRQPARSEGRPRIKLNWKLVNGLCQLQCTHEEIASLLACSVDTLDRAARREHGVSFAEYFGQKALGGRISLRRAQMKSAIGGSVPMQIWLGKQYLGQRENRDEVPNDFRDVARAVRAMVGALFAVEQ
jgi:hypothetical protein